MPCSYCNQPSVSHTLVSCKEIVPVVEIHCKKIDTDFCMFRGYNHFKNWLRNLSLPELKRLAKKYGGKMVQPRIGLEKTVIERLYTVVKKCISINLVRVNIIFDRGGGDSLEYTITCLNNIYSPLSRFFELIKTQINPESFWKLCKVAEIKSHEIEHFLKEREENIQEICLTAKCNSLFKNIANVRTYVNKYRENRNEHTHKKTRLVLKRLNFNTDIFRHIASFL